ncbi:MAG TPA: hypothetical protein VI792_10420 [Candidatus Eisenbacteria bacterium]
MPLEPAPPLLRDRWAWVSALAVLPVVIHAWGAPLGEAVAEDFDFLHRMLFSKNHTLLDGGGSTAFWRPVSHQLYYEALGPLILSHPGIVSFLHVLMLALSSVLFYRTFRRVWPGPAAAVVATFPLLSESTRTLISWPSHFVDLGAWLFTAIAAHETAARRLWSALLALLASLLCKEVTVVIAVLLPWMPGLGPRGRAERVRWTLAMGAVAAVWGAAYLGVRHYAHLALPHHLETRADVARTPLVSRLWWSIFNSLRALFSLPAVHTPWVRPVTIAASLLFAVAILTVLLRRKARRRLVQRYRALGAWGAVWFVAASATLVPIFPIWAPNRSGFGSLGLGALATAITAAAHPALLGGLVAIRLAAFAVSPGPPERIMGKVPDEGAFMDFERLARLQRLMRETRVMLETHFPTMPPGAMVGQHYLPRMSEYAYGGSKALQVWYRDSTLRWVRYADFVTHPATPLTVIAEFQPKGRPQVAPVNPVAMRWFLAGLDSMNHRNWDFGLSALAKAESIQTDTSAMVFRGEIWGERATCLVFMHDAAAAEGWAARGLSVWDENIYANFALGCIAYERNDLEAAAAKFDSVLRFSPNYTAARQLRQQVQQEIVKRDAGRPPPPP